jgi:hypothetical protein
VRLILAALSGLVALSVPVPAAADPPTETTAVQQFLDVNPCTGLEHTVTINLTISEHFHDGRVVGHAKRTITTDPTGFVGHGTDSLVDNERIFKFRLTDILTSPSGDRIRARFLLVIDQSTETIRVEKGEVTCLGPA